mmetsp:Transcript_65076/g.101622  ORF Transcript_65076/g.101622 Transcript_65076/m.101622 type:complete len:599 (-) Transcript_65076:10-1806(-)
MMTREAPQVKLKGAVRMQKGSKVQVNNLQNSKELNGRVGKLLEFDAVKLRWGVELENGKKVALKMGNLIPLEMEELLPAVEVPHIGPTIVDESESTTTPILPTGTMNVSVEPSPEESRDAQTSISDDAKDERILESERSPEETNDRQGVPSLNDDEEWPVLPTSEATKAKIQSGCWWDGGSAAKRFTEQLKANDPTLLSVCLVPPKRFNEEDAEEVCVALEANTVCEELVASGHVLSRATCERLASMITTTKTLRALSLGESSLGDLGIVLFDGLAQNLSLTALDLEHKGLTLEACRSLANALRNRQSLQAASLDSLKLSRNVAIASALADGIEFVSPKKLQLSECTLGLKHAEILGRWVLGGIEELDLRDNSSLGGEGVELLLQTLVPDKSSQPPALRRLRLDGCAIGDDGVEQISLAMKRGLNLEALFVERCEITLSGCEFLAEAANGRRLHTLSARANVIGDDGCILLARCAERLDLSSTGLSGQILGTLGEQELISLELFSNPTLGPSVTTWCNSLDSAQWQRLEYLDLTGCALKDAGFECVCNTLIQRPDLMPMLKDLLIGANEVKEDDDKCNLIDRLGVSRGGRLATKWTNA